MRTAVRCGVAAVCVAAGLAAWAGTAAWGAGAMPKGHAGRTAPAAQVERGRYLVTIMACGDCHTPWKMGPNGPAPDASRLLSGHPEGLAMPAPPKMPAGPWVWIGAGTNTAFAGPWGVSYAINLTPDPATGLGPWTETMFRDALRKGRHWGEGRGVLPPMPWPAYAHMTDQDIAAIWAYLQTVPPIHNTVPASQPAPPPPAAR